MRSIRIIGAPSGVSIPQEVLCGWVGTEIPLIEGCWGHVEDCVWVRYPIALEALRNHCPESAAYWEMQGPRCPVAKFVFPSHIVRFE